MGKARMKTVNTAPQEKPASVKEDMTKEDIIKSLKIRKARLEPRNETQAKMLELIEAKEITFVSGPAGTGKSYLSVVKALELLSTYPEKYQQIIIITPAVEADEELGALPGTLEEKLSPYTYSTFYLFEKILGKRKVEKLIEDAIIKVMGLGFLRGINIDNSIVIFEEAQNSTRKQMKTFLTRIGFDTKYIISGDLEQIDRKKTSQKLTGLHYAIENLKKLDEIGVIEFGKKDVVRNAVIEKILDCLPQED